MKIEEFLEGTGVWKVRAADLPDEIQFIRGDDKGDKVQPLLHVCEREVLQREAGHYYACVSGRVFWNWFHGRYECMECREQFDTDEELIQIWGDGKGTGIEGHA